MERLRARAFRRAASGEETRRWPWEKETRTILIWTLETGDTSGQRGWEEKKTREPQHSSSDAQKGLGSQLNVQHQRSEFMLFLILIYGLEDKCQGKWENWGPGRLGKTCSTSWLCVRDTHTHTHTHFWLTHWLTNTYTHFPIVGQTATYQHYCYTISTSYLAQDYQLSTLLTNTPSWLRLVDEHSDMCKD